MKPAKAFLALALPLLCIGLSAVAEAQPARPKAGDTAQKGPRVTIKLEASANDSPSHVCLISFQAAKKTIRIESDLEPSTAPPLDPSRTTYLINEVNWNKLITKEPRQERGPGDQQSCTGLLNICRPSFTLQRRGSLTHFIQCAGNQRSGDAPAEQRVAVLLVDVHTHKSDIRKQPIIDDLRLEKNLVSFDMQRLEQPEDRVIGSIVGGDYAESPTAVLSGDYKMELPLARKCQEHEIALPPTAGSGHANVTLMLGDETPDRETAAECKQQVSPNGRFKMLLPYLRRHARRTVEVDVRVPNRESGRYTRYEGSWFDFEPPDVLSLRYAAISFRWQRDCLYPLERDARTGRLSFECPEASLLDAGIDRCEGYSSPDHSFDECVYVCDPRGEREGSEDSRMPDVTFDLPGRVRFRRPGRDDVWIETLQYGNQVLSGFVPPEDRHIDVDLSKWGNLKETLRRPAAAIDSIIIRGPNGDLHFVKLKEDNPVVRIDLPGVRCGEAIGYQIRGERRHEEVTVAVEDGRIELEPPEMSEEWARPVVFAGGSGILTWLLESQDRASHETPTEPLFLMGMGLDLRPRGWAITFTPEYAFLFGPQSYYPLGYQDVAVAAAPMRVAYARHLVNVAALYMLSKKFQVGGAVGTLLSHPLLWEDQGRVGAFGVAFVTTPLLVRYQPLDRWSFEGAGRILWDEEIYQFESDFRGAPRALEFENIRFAFDLRVRFSI
ncbi:MAG: hypothetical protein HUU21_11760 [Polyangiaceae bacterium]|nr:hypothetical protein [Polyangiaceae bacterium]